MSRYHDCASLELIRTLDLHFCVENMERIWEQRDDLEMVNLINSFETRILDDEYCGSLAFQMKWSIEHYCEKCNSSICTKVEHSGARKVCFWADYAGTKMQVLRSLYFKLYTTGKHLNDASCNSKAQAKAQSLLAIGELSWEAARPKLCLFSLGELDKLAFAEGDLYCQVLIEMFKSPIDPNKPLIKQKENAYFGYVKSQMDGEMNSFIDSLLPDMSITTNVGESIRSNSIYLRANTKEFEDCLKEDGPNLINMDCNVSRKAVDFVLAFIKMGRIGDFVITSDDDELPTLTDILQLGKRLHLNHLLKMIDTIIYFQVTERNAYGLYAICKKYQLEKTLFYVKAFIQCQHNMLSKTNDV